jgi:hypothetical protein
MYRSLNRIESALQRLSFESVFYQNEQGTQGPDTAIDSHGMDLGHNTRI